MRGGGVRDWEIEGSKRRVDFGVGCVCVVCVLLRVISVLFVFIR